MQFRLTINCDNSAFDETPEQELARCLREVATRLERGEDFGHFRNISDANGNIVGQCALKPRDRF